MNLIKLTLLTDDNMNGASVWFHKDELRRVLPLPNGGSGVHLLNGEPSRFQESVEQIVALVNGHDPLAKQGTVAKQGPGRPKKINMFDEQENQQKTV